MRRTDELSAEQVEKAVAGDRTVRERIVRRVDPILRGYFIRRIGMKVEVDDLVQNTLLRVVNGLQDLQHPAAFMGFVMKAALFELQDYYRGRYGFREQLFDPEFLPEHATSEQVTDAMRIDIERALGSLTHHARRIMELKEYGYRYKEIADMLATTEAAVKMQVKRAYERLRAQLEEDSAAED